MSADWSRALVLGALGRAVRELRARRALSQEGLGNLAGLHRNYIGAIERGEVSITFRVLLKVAHGLDVTPCELVTVFERNHMRQLGALPGQTSGSQERR